MGAHCIEVEHGDHCERVYARAGSTAVSFASFASSSADAEELRDGLYRAHRRPLRTVLDGQRYVLRVRITESFGEDTFEVKIEPAGKLDPTVAPRFTPKQGQYLAFIYNYSKIHGRAPAESDLQRYFQVSAPSVHEMIKTLERAGFIERTPGQARSIRLLVRPDHLPVLG